MASGLLASKSSHSFSSQPEKTLVDVGLSFDGKKVFFIFANGEGYTIVRRLFPQDDGSPITRMEIFDHGCAVVIHQASGCAYELPWDSIKHYARGGTREKVKTIGERLKKLRQARTLTQAELAERAALSRVHLTRLETNRSEPSLDTIIRLAEALSVPAAQLLQ